MARNLSPSTQVAEIDKSFYVESAAVLPTALALPTSWGPADEPTVLANEQSFVSTFGKPTSYNIENWLVGSDFLADSAGLYVNRSIDAATGRNAVADKQYRLALVLRNVAGDFSNELDVDIMTTVPITADVISWDASSKVLILDYSPEVDVSAGVSVVGVSGAASAIVAVRTSAHAPSSHILVKNDVIAENYINNSVNVTGLQKLQLTIGAITGNFAANDIVSVGSVAALQNIKVISYLSGVLVLRASAVGFSMDNLGDLEVTNVTQTGAGYVTAVSALAPTITPTFCARYPGQIANGLGIAIVDHGAANINVIGNGSVISGVENLVSPLDSVTGTSSFAINNGYAGLCDLFHIVIFDMNGHFSGEIGSVLERFEGVSKLADATNDQNESIYWKDVINQKSEYLWVLNNPATSTGVPATRSEKAVVYGVGVVPMLATSIQNYAGPTFTNPASFAAALGNHTLQNGEYFLLPNQGATPGANASNGLYQWVDVTGTTGYAEHVALSSGDVVYCKGGTTLEKYFKYTTSTSFAVVAPVTVPTLTVSGGYGGWGISLTQVKTSDNLARMSVVKASSYDSVSHNGWQSILGGGSDGATSNIEAAIQQSYTNMFDKANISIRQILGGNASASLAKFLVAFAQARQDCVAFLSPEKSTQVGITNQDRIVKNVVEWAKFTLNTNSSYGFLDGGWYLRFDKYSGTNVWVPLNGQTAGLSAIVDSTLNPWWVFSGYRRGVYSNVIKLAYNPNLVQRDLLYPAAVNPVISEPGQGVILLGDKTLYNKPSAFSRVNVRKLFIVVEEQIRAYAKYNMFEFNDSITRTEFVNAITPFLQNIKDGRGITEFSVKCDESNNPSSVIDNHEFVATVMIKPNLTINWIKLNFVAVGQSVSISAVQI